MRLTPGFIAAAVVCAAPFGLAIRDDLKRKSFAGSYDGDDDAESYSARRARAYMEAEEEQMRRARDEAEHGSRTPDQDVPAAVAVKPSLTGDDLRLLVGTAPATMGPLLSGVVLGASSQSFLPETSRERIEAYKQDHDFTIDYDFDEVSLNGVTIRATGEESALRDAMIAAWGTPRRLGEDELVWLGADGQRAVYSALEDGFDLTFARYATVDEIIAPKDRTKLGVEPFPVLGARIAKLEAALGARLQSSSYDEDREWAAPGIGNGSGRTMVRVTLDDNDTTIVALHVEGATADTDQIRDALVAKWGKPTYAVDGGDSLTWKKSGATIIAVIDERGFTIDARK